MSGGPTDAAPLNSGSGHQGKFIADLALTVLMFVATVLIIVLALQRLGTNTGRTGTVAEAAPLPREPLSIRNSATKGRTDAPVKMFIYSDFQCPFCARMATDVLPEIEKRYVATGQLALIFRHLPLEGIHPMAMSAAQAAECAGEQEKFWEMHDRLFQAPSSLGTSRLLEHGSDMGLDTGRFGECLEGRSANLVADLEEAQTLGLIGTPEILLGRSRHGQTVEVQRRLGGLQSVDALSRAIAELLK